MVGVSSVGIGKDRDERILGGLAKEVSVVALGVERGRGSAEEAMVTQMAKDDH